MSDTFTESLRLQLQGTGNNANTWGTIANTDFSLIEAALTGDNGFAGGTGSGGINLAGLTTYTLTANDGSTDQSRQLLYPFVGALTATCTVTIPAVVKIGFVCNNTTGSQNIVLTTGSGNSLTLWAPNTPNNLGAGAGPFVWTMFYCDGTNVSAVNFSTQFKPLYIGWLAQGTNINIVANGTTIGAATALTAAWNVVGSASNSNNAILLDDLQPFGSATFIINETAYMLQLFPGDGGSNINALAAGVAYPIPPYAQGNPALIVAVRVGTTQWYVTGGWVGTSYGAYAAAGSGLSSATVTYTQISAINGGTGGVAPIDSTPQNVVLDYLNYTGSTVALYPGDSSSVINLLSAGAAVTIPAASGGLPGVMHLIRNTATQWFAWTG